MNPRRLLTVEEAALIEEAAERWLRMRQFEFNAGESAAALLAQAQLRPEGCTRRDIASLGRALLLEIPGELEPRVLTLVRPQEEDLARGHVSILSDIGLACIGQVICSEIPTPRGSARFIGFADTRPFAQAAQPLAAGSGRPAERLQP